MYKYAINRWHTILQFQLFQSLLWTAKLLRFHTPMSYKATQINKLHVSSLKWSCNGFHPQTQKSTIQATLPRGRFTRYNFVTCDVFKKKTFTQIIACKSNFE